MSRDPEEIKSIYITVKLTTYHSHKHFQIKQHYHIYVCICKHICSIRYIVLATFFNVKSLNGAKKIMWNIVLLCLHFKTIIIKTEESHNKNRI